MQPKIQGGGVGCPLPPQVFNLKIPTIRKFCLFEGRFGGKSWSGGKFVVDHVGSKTEVV